MFIAQQQQKHSSRLWTPLKWAGEPLFDKAPTAYARFRSLMHRTPVVFTPKSGPMSSATFLLPGMPVSDGVLPVVEQMKTPRGKAIRLSRKAEDRMIFGLSSGGIAAFNRIASKDKQLRLLSGVGHGWHTAGFEAWLFNLPQKKAQ